MVGVDAAFGSVVVLVEGPGTSSGTSVDVVTTGGWVWVTGGDVERGTSVVDVVDVDEVELVLLVDVEVRVVGRGSSVEDVVDDELDEVDGSSVVVVVDSPVVDEVVVDGPGSCPAAAGENATEPRALTHTATRNASGAIRARIRRGWRGSGTRRRAAIEGPSVPFAACAEGFRRAAERVPQRWW